jgi:streptogramin lyase
MHIRREALLPIVLVFFFDRRPLSAQTITEFPLPTAGSPPTSIVAGPDGALWFTEYDGHKIGRITTAGLITEFAIPHFASPAGIVAGPDGNLWFAENDGNSIGRITTGGVITEFPIPTGRSGPGWIVAGPDGNLWFTELDGNKIGRITTAGVITEFPIPTASGVPPRSGVPRSITAGPDGNLVHRRCEQDRADHHRGDNYRILDPHALKPA